MLELNFRALLPNLRLHPESGSVLVPLDFRIPPLILADPQSRLTRDDHL